MRRRLCHWLIVPPALLAVAAPFGAGSRLPADPLALPALDGSLALATGHWLGPTAARLLRPWPLARVRLASPAWSFLAGHPLWWLAAAALLLLAAALLSARASRRPGRRRAARGLLAGGGAAAWAAALLLVPAWVVTAPWLADRRGRSWRLPLAGIVLALAVGSWLGRTGGGEWVPRDAPPCRRWLWEHQRRTAPWGPLLDAVPAARAAAALAGAASANPACRDLRRAAAATLLAAGVTTRAAVHLEVWRRQWPDDTEGRLTEAWRLLLDGRAGAALRRFRALRAAFPAAAAAGEICALARLGRRDAARTALARWSFRESPPQPTASGSPGSGGRADQSPGR